MILTRPITHRRPTTLLVLTVLAGILSGGLTAFGAGPTTRPATQRVKAGVDPVSKLTAEAPTGWTVRSSTRVGGAYLHPGRQWSKVSTGYVELRSTLVQTQEGLQRAARPIIVWLAHSQAEKVRWRVGESHRSIETKPTEYLGIGSGYHVYIHLPPDAARIWPAAKRAIGKALGIKGPTTRPAGSTEKGAILLMTKNGDAVSYTLDGVDCSDIKALGEALAKVSKDSPLVIRIETNVSSGRVAEVLAVARKLRMTKISIAIVRTSRPPAKPKWKPPL